MHRQNKGEIQHEKNNCIHQKSLNIVTIPEMLMSEKTPLFRGFLAHFSSDYCQSPDPPTHVVD